MPISSIENHHKSNPKNVAFAPNGRREIRLSHFEFARPHIPIPQYQKCLHRIAQWESADQLLYNILGRCGISIVLFTVLLLNINKGN